MENNELKNVSIKNRMCCYFNDLIIIEDFDFDNILLDEKPNGNILFYNVSYRYLIGAKPLRIMFDKVDGFIGVYDGSRHLMLIGPEKYEI